MTPWHPSPSTVAELRPEHRALLDRFRIFSVERPDDPLFALAYAGLHDHFGAEGQIEAKDVLARIVAAPIAHRGVRVAHPILVMLDDDDQLAAASGRYVTYEPGVGIVAGLDGSGYVAPPYRRQGIASVAMPLLIDAGARRLGAPAAATVLDLGDIGLVTEDDPVSIGRALVWGRGGCAVIPPSVFPLRLVGMKRPDAPDEVAPPVPLLAVLRDPAGTRAQPTHVAKASLRALARHLEAAHSWAGDAAGLTDETARLVAAIDAGPADPVPLVPLPTSFEAIDPFQRLFALSREVGMVGTA